MTKKDYILISTAVAQSYIAVTENATCIGEQKRCFDLLVEVLAIRLKKENSKFNPDLFIKACNIK